MAKLMPNRMPQNFVMSRQMGFPDRKPQGQWNENEMIKRSNGELQA
jgi:hypothetical protein